MGGLTKRERKLGHYLPNRPWFLLPTTYAIRRKERFGQRFLSRTSHGCTARREYARCFATLRNDTAHPIQVEILRLSWLKGTTELEGEDIAGPDDVILPGDNIFFTFTVQKNAQSKWTLDTPSKISVTKTMTPEIDEDKRKALKEIAALIKEIRVLNTKRILIITYEGNLYHYKLGAEINIYNNSKQEIRDIVLQISGVDNRNIIYEIAIVHFDELEPRKNQLNTGALRKNEGICFYECCYDDMYNHIDRYESRIVSIGKKKDEFKK